MDTEDPRAARIRVIWWEYKGVFAVVVRQFARVFCVSVCMCVRGGDGVFVDVVLSGGEIVGKCERYEVDGYATYQSSVMHQCH